MNVLVQEKPKQLHQQSKPEDKLVALKIYRHKNNLCFKCGNKWGLNHKCPPQVSLHVIEELLGALEAFESNNDSEEFDIVEETAMAVGSSVPSDPIRSKTMWFCGRISKKDVLILVDSGNVVMFISSQLVRHPAVANNGM